MTAPSIQFANGAGYEAYMGVWSRLAGDVFLDWLSPKPGLRWLDVGCGNGASTALLAARCAPASLHGVDPSEAQIAFAHERGDVGEAEFRVGDAMALPYPDEAFDMAVMPLVIFFVPVPVQGVAEMVRAVRPGGSVSAYAWDMTGGGFPYEILRQELVALNIAVPREPHPEASRLDVLHRLWSDAGLEAVETLVIPVTRTFASFEEFWTIVQAGPSVGPSLAALTPEDSELLKTRLRTRLVADAEGRITYGAVAHAVKGRVPAAPEFPGERS